MPKKFRLLDVYIINNIKQTRVQLLTINTKLLENDSRYTYEYSIGVYW